MARGGKREGAGRKPQLETDVIDAIRRDCEQRANVLKHEQALRRHERKLAKRGLVRNEDGEKDIVDLVPLSERRTVIRFGIREPENMHFPEALSAEARAAIDFIRSNRKFFGAYSEPLPRLAHGRQAILESVARDWDISVRMVREIWETSPAV